MTSKIRPGDPKVGLSQGGSEVPLPFPCCQMKEDSQYRNTVEATSRTAQHKEEASTRKPENIHTEEEVDQAQGHFRPKAHRHDIKSDVW